MSDKTLVGVYRLKKKMPTQADIMVSELCEITHRSPLTVKSWVLGHHVPDINTQIIIAKHLQSEPAILFPAKKKGHRYGND